MTLGKAWFIAKRRVQWYLPGNRYAAGRSATQRPHQHASHRTPLLRQLKGVDMWLQHNKVESLKVAASCIDGLLLRPGETFSFWRLVGKPSARRGFKTGLAAQWNGGPGHGRRALPDGQPDLLDGAAYGAFHHRTLAPRL